MAIFRPPTENVTFMGNASKPFDGPDKRLMNRLLAHYAPLPRGKNVYKLIDGTYSEDEQYDVSQVAITYHGGHEIPVSAQEVADLTAAGYGAYIS